MSELAERLLTLVNLAPAWGESPKAALLARAEDLDAEKKRVRQREAKPGVNGAAAHDEQKARLTDVGNSLRFARQHQDRARYCAPWGVWLLWAGSHWQEDAKHAIDLLAKETVRTIFLEAGDRTGVIADRLRDWTPGAESGEQFARDDDAAKALRTHALKSEAAPRIAAMLRLAQSEMPVTPEELDRDHFLFNCENGTLDLRTGEFRDHRRQDHITKVAPVAYDPKANCPGFEKALRSIFPEQPLENDAPGDEAMIQFIQRLFGMCLGGDVSAQVLTVLHGDGSNGKSTLLETVCAVLGPYAGPAPKGLLEISHGERHPAELADLFGMRLVHSTETGEGARLDEAQVKRLTGGDMIKARKLYQDWFTFVPTHKLMICTNHRPRIRGADHAIWRRMLLVPFDARFWDPKKKAKPGEVRAERFRKDDHLINDKFAGERSGVLNWLLAGFHEWKARGLCPPDGVQAASEEYCESQNLVSRFLTERVKSSGDPDDRVKSGDLYAAFAQWAEQSGERRSVSRKDFTLRVTAATGCKTVKSTSRYLVGIRLLTDAEMDGEDGDAGERPELDL